MERAGSLRTVVPRHAADDDARGAHDADGRAAWRAFPFRWPDLGRFAVVWLVLTAVFVAVGLVLVHVLVHGFVGDVDHEAARWFADRRTPTVDDLTQIGAGLADAYTVIPALLILSVLFVVLWRRWNETVLLLTAVLLEKAVFVTTTYIVDRPRPPVGQLDGHPPTSSFPSGHVASAVSVYGVVALIVWAHTDRRWLRALVATVAVVVPVIVALSRMILGMHYLTDVVVGATLGVVALVVGTRLAARTVEDLDARRHLHRRSEAQQPATERDGAQGEPGRAERGAGRDVAQPVHTEQHA
jgi:membrane-associated phospholipid phosphatase